MFVFDLIDCRGCLTPKVIANIHDSIDEEGNLNFELLDGFDELSAEVQDKVKKTIESGELDEADKTVVSNSNLAIAARWPIAHRYHPLGSWRGCWRGKAFPCPFIYTRHRIY